MGRSFEAAFEAEFASLHRYLARRLGASLADELAAETFAVALRRWDRLDPERPVRPWLYGIATNVMAHHRRSELRRFHAMARLASTRIEDRHDIVGDRVSESIDADQAWAFSGLAKIRADSRSKILFLELRLGAKAARSFVGLLEFLPRHCRLIFCR